MNNLALIGKKIGMSREFFKTGQSVPVTVLKMETGRVINVINKEISIIWKTKISEFILRLTIIKF